MAVNGTIINDGELISSYMVLREIKDDNLLNWLGRFKERFLPLSQDLQQKATEILRIYPNLIQFKSIANSDADPFIIAQAILSNGTIITDEKPIALKDNTKRVKIPNVCSDLSIPCQNSIEFINTITT